MASFFEKLKKGMGASDAQEEVSEEIKEEAEEETITPEKIEEKIVEKPKRKTRTAFGKKEGGAEKKIIETKVEEEENKQTETMEQKQETAKTPSGKNSEEKWASFSKEAEGQLAIDVYQTDDELVIQSAIAGVKPESIDIDIEGDMVTIRGSREKPQEEGSVNYFYQECFWGPFSRQIILSVEVDPSRTEASLKDGILTVRIPRIERERKRKIVVNG